MENNFYNMNNVSKSTLERNKRIQNQAASFLAEYDKTLKESLDAKEQNKTNAAMSSARMSYSSGIARSRARVTNLTEEINYTVNSSIIGMTEMISQVVENALLLDESEFAELNPNYKTEIREIVSGFLREAEINEEITNEHTLAIMEHVARTLPGVKEGKNLTEDDLSNFVVTKSPLEINRSIKSLSGDVASRVATLMEKEQKRAEKTEKDVKRAVNKKEKDLADEKDPSVADANQLIQALEAGEIEVEDIDAMLQDGEISQDIYDKVVDAYMDYAEGTDNNVDAEGETSGELAAQAQNPAVGAEMGAEDPNAMPADPAMDAGMAPEGEVPPMEDPAMMGAEDPNAMPADPMTGEAAPAIGGVAPGMPKKQVQMLPDGTMNINIYEACENFDTMFINCVLTEGRDVDLVDKSYKDATYASANGIRRAMKALTANQILCWVLAPFSWGATVPGGIASTIVKNTVLKGRLKDRELDLIEYTKDKADVKEFIEKIRNAKTEKEAKYMAKQLRGLLQRYYPEMEHAKKNSLKETYLVRETPRCGLIESLAVNDAMNRLAEGKSYDPDLSLANAIMYVTITETMNAMGLMNIDEQAYNHIIAEAGGNPNPKENNVMVHKSSKATDVSCENTKMANDVAEALEKNHIKATDVKNSLINESVLVKQYVPVLNNRPDSNDFAERIRQRKIMKESGTNNAASDLLID